MENTFTVVITQQHHLDSMQQYNIFLEPFTKQKGIALCRWFPDGENLHEAVPELFETVAGQERWRAIIVTDDEGIEQRNPFDLVPCDLPQRPDATDDSAKDLEDAEAYFKQVEELKLAAYNQAAKQPLTRLGTWLCSEPVISSGLMPLDDESAREMKLYKPYAYIEHLIYNSTRAAAQNKQKIRNDIRGKYIEPEFCLPEEVLCLAMRNCEDLHAALDNSWTSHLEYEYSQFCDRNMYFDKMRFLVFDILHQGHEGYDFDYLRFLYTLLVLAGNETPVGCLAPNRVYRLECENNEKVLRQVMSQYDLKLSSTEDMLKSKKLALQFKIPAQLRDRDAEILFCSGVTVPVSNYVEFDTDRLYAPAEKIGLSTDCPEDEMSVWSSKSGKSSKAFRQYIKQPQRAVRRAARAMHEQDTADLNLVRRLNKFQLEDINEHTGSEEVRMVNARAESIFNVKQYEKRIKKSKKEVDEVIERRMTKKTTVILGCVMLAICLLCLLPSLIRQQTGIGAYGIMAGVLLCLFGVVFITALVTLLFLRLPLKWAYSNYNKTMRSIVNNIGENLGQYADYMGHACNVMRGYSVINYLADSEDPDTLEMRIIQKHITDITRARRELHEVFGRFIDEKPNYEDDDPEVFTYDFTRPVDYQYPICYSAEQRARIDFMQTGNSAQIPVGFIDRIVVRREELYD